MTTAKQINDKEKAQAPVPKQQASGRITIGQMASIVANARAKKFQRKGPKGE